MTETQGRHGYHFQLRPFAPVRDSHGFCFGGSLHRLPGVLAIEYRLEGDLRSVVWPAPCAAISRRHDLWRQTCFEIFFGIPGESAYWEVNLGPGGCWNLYHFTDYRQGMHEDASVDRLTCHMARDGDTFSLACRINVKKIVPDCLGLEVGAAGVVFDTTGAVSYWAIDHLEAMPDFHIRKSFLIVLPGVAKK
ncbi:MAG: DOMON-like domain-containing protein [Proteobacteria bacterium]|nr:DOMON-like domain-containing protein [Pseudomonadota bacterium]